MNVIIETDEHGTEHRDVPLDSIVRNEYHTYCHDCGKFITKDRWIKKDNPHGYTHALCYDCASLYDSPWDC